MNNLLFFDTKESEHLLPISYTRSAAKIRVGILNIHEKWEKRLKIFESTFSPYRKYLQEGQPIPDSKECLGINGRLLPTDSLINEIHGLELGKGLILEGEAIVFKGSPGQFRDNEIIWKEIESEALMVNRTYDVFRLNGQELISDYELLTSRRESAPIPAHCRVLAPENIFIENGATLTMATLNATDGPIYIGKDSVVMENASIRGPFALCEGSQVKMAAKIYSNTTIGPHSKVGGELNNVVIQGYSNKGHDGFLGNAYIGEWCNLGADTNNSNLKNNYDEVRLWNEVLKGFEKTGLTFCGLIMGDHSKSGINTMFNTGTSIGVGCNIFGSGFPRNYIPSFSWGGKQGFQDHRFDKFIKTVEIVMMRRKKELAESEIAILRAVYDEIIESKNKK